MKLNIALLGSTGSIGTQALSVCNRLGIQLAALSANCNVKKLEQQIRQYRPPLACMMNEQAAADLKQRVADTATKVVAGLEGLCQCASLDCDAVLNSVVGMVGLLPTLTAIENGTDVLLANKETLVAGGQLVMRRAKEKGVHLIPVDSEHSAIFRCLQGSNHPAKEIKRIILTASGGPFFGKTHQQLLDVTASDALRHPNWDMGAKITIDSATLMNKGLEYIEAYWLFGVSLEQIEIVVHRQSIVHSLVEFADCSMLAHLGVPDMKIPIQYALTYPEQCASDVQPLDLFKAGRLDFAAPDCHTFRCLPICMEAIRQGGLKPAALNGANEQAVQLFLEGKIGFLEIADLVERAVQAQSGGNACQITDIVSASSQAKEFVLSQIK